MEHNQVQEWIAQQRQAGHNDQTISASLIANGWDPSLVPQLLSGGAQQPMAQPQYSTPPQQVVVQKKSKIPLIIIIAVVTSLVIGLGGWATLRFMKTESVATCSEYEAIPSGACKTLDLYQSRAPLDQWMTGSAVSQLESLGANLDSVLPPEYAVGVDYTSWIEAPEGEGYICSDVGGRSFLIVMFEADESWRVAYTVDAEQLAQEVYEVKETTPSCLR